MRYNEIHWRTILAKLVRLVLCTFPVEAIVIIIYYGVSTYHWFKFTRFQLSSDSSEHLYQILLINST
jgi:hypothetical protein